jgi:hypothetical protein
MWRSRIRERYFRAASACYENRGLPNQHFLPSWCPARAGRTDWNSLADKLAHENNELERADRYRSTGKRSGRVEIQCVTRRCFRCCSASWPDAATTRRTAPVAAPRPRPSSARSVWLSAHRSVAALEQPQAPPCQRNISTLERHPGATGRDRLSFRRHVCRQTQFSYQSNPPAVHFKIDASGNIVTYKVCVSTDLQPDHENERRVRDSINVV